MAKTTEDRVKLLVGIINRSDEKAYAEAVNECCISVKFTGFAAGTARSNYLSYLGLDETEKRLVYSLIPNYCEKTVLKSINRRLRLYLMGKGIAFTVPLAGVSSIISSAVLTTPHEKEEQPEVKGGNRRMADRKQIHELIIATVNQKFTDRALESARLAGATGATILHTRSLENEKAEQVIGTTLKSETDTIALLASNEYKQKIMEAIRDTAGLKTDGGAVIFSVPVDAIAGIGRFDEETAAEQI